MSIYEYNEEYVRKVLHEDGYNEGYGKGEKEGYGKGEANGYRRGIVEAVDVMVNNFHIELSRACESVGISEKDYVDEKQNIPMEYYEKL